MIGGEWACASTDPGAADDPSDLAAMDLAWVPAEVPGTVAAALRAQGLWTSGVADRDRLDGRDWWFRGRFVDPGNGPWSLRMEGLATLADVWLNGVHLLHSEDMFVEHELDIDCLRPIDEENELCFRFAALDPVLACRRPRPRWRSRLVRHQNLRWIRTSLLGRMDGWAAWAAPVGPWRPVELVSRGASPRILDSTIDARCLDGGGAVSLRATLVFTGVRPATARLRVGEQSASLELTDDPSGDASRVLVDGTVTLPSVERWWPHTHGAQPRYPVTLEIDDTTIDMPTVGFRELAVDRRDDGFTFVVNGMPIFCRGALWVPPDVVSLTAAPGDLRASLELLRAAGMNMVRLGGYGTYESPEFWDLCDELGVMVWQDCMLASFDPPDDAEFTRLVERELHQVFTRLQGRPAVALVCGSSETYQQAAMYGRELGSWASPILEETIPAIVERVLPGVPYIASSPIGGQLPFDPTVGVGHYFGVGAYERPLSDLRVVGVRFAAECLAFSNPPERASVEEMFGSSTFAGHSAAWKAGVARDSGTSWDFEDVRDFYVRHLFGCDPGAVRYEDPEWALDLGRAATAELMSAVMSDWRRPDSRCAGGLVLSWRDLWAGAGWGIVDSLGRPKAPWYALRRVLSPLAVLITDEGLSGLHLHVVNDRPHPFNGRLRLAAYADDGLRVEYAERAVEVGAHGACTVSATEMLGGFRDLTRAYRFGPPAHEVVTATIVSADDGSEHEAFYVSSPGVERRPDVGLTASVTRRAGEEWVLTIATRLFAQWVAIDAAGFAPSDTWFHLAPGAQRTVRLRGADADRVPRGDVRALNSRVPSSITVEDPA